MNILLLIKKWFNAGGKRRKWTAVLLTISAIITGFLMFSGSSTPQSTTLEPAPLYFAGVIVKLISVLLLIIGGAIILRRWQVKNGMIQKGRSLSVLETVRLSPKQAIHLVQIGKQHLLIGATDQSISLLSTIEEDEVSPLEEKKLAESDLSPASFTQVLQSLTSG